MKMPPYNKRWGWKMPKLIEAYKHFTGREMEGAHSALCDAKGCMEVYFAIQELQQEPAQASA